MSPEPEVTAAAPARNARGVLSFLRAQQVTFAGGSLITVAFNGAALAAYALGAILVARVVGPEQWGYVMWFTAGTTTISLFADVLGIYYSNAFLIARGAPNLNASVARSSVLAYGLLMGAIAGSLFFLAPVRAAVFRGFSEPAWSWLIAVNIAGLVLIAQARGLFLGARSFLLTGALNLLKSGAFAALSVAAVFALGVRSGVDLAVAQVAATWLCVLAVLGYFVWRGLARPAFAHIRSCMGVGWRAAGVNWLSFLHQRADQYMVNTFLGTTAVGLYAAVVSIGELITQIPGILGMVLFPLTAADPDQRGAARKTLRRTLIVMAVVALLTLPAAYFAEPLITLIFGEKFRDSAVLLRYFLPAVVFLSGLLMVNQHIAGMGYPPYQLWGMLLALTMNIALNLALLPRMGVAAAPLAASLSFAFWLAWMGAYLVRTAVKES